MSYPKMLYTTTGVTRVVASAAEEAALNANIWQDNPANFGLLTAPSTAQIAANSAAVSTTFPNARRMTADTVSYQVVRVRAPLLGF